MPAAAWYNATNSGLVNTIYGDISEGWESVKLLEIVIIPYAYYLLRPNHVCQVLFYIALLDILHNTFAYTAYYISVLNLVGSSVTSTPYDTTWLWYCQASCAGLIRVLELYTSWLLVKVLCDESQKKTLIGISIFSAMGVIFGRIYDVYASNFLSDSTIRPGMAIVAAAGMIQSTYTIYILRKSLMEFRQSDSATTKSPTGALGTPHKGKAFELISHSSTRVIFIQSIDFGVLLGSMYMRASIYTLWWDMIFGVLDNSRALFLLFDLLLTRALFSNKGRAGAMAERPSPTGQVLLVGGGGGGAMNLGPQTDNRFHPLSPRGTLVRVSPLIKGTTASPAGSQRLPHLPTPQGETQMMSGFAGERKEEKQVEGEEENKEDEARDTEMVSKVVDLSDKPK